MSEVKCPLCGKPLETRLIADFWLCRDCKVAVRSENDMPLKKTDIYNEAWVKAQEESRYILKKSRYLLAKIKELHGVRRILDVGCGTGILVDILSRSGYTVTGIDSSPEAIEFAKRNKQGNFELASAESFQSQEKYDLIVAAQLIEHLGYPEVFLTEVKDLLKYMGYLLLETPNLNSWNEKSLWRRRIGGMFYGADHRICYTSKSLSRLLESNGFQICKILTKTYPPTIFTEAVRTLLAPSFAEEQHIREEQLYPVNPQRRRPTFNGVLKRVYGWLVDSSILSTILIVPEQISELHVRGNQLIIIGRKIA